MSRLRAWFPDREFFMRSEGHVRFVRVSSKLQMALAGGVAAVALTWLGTMTTVLVSNLLASDDRLALLEREAKVQSAESRVAEYRRNLDTVASDLQKRQDFIEKAVEANFGELPDANLPKGTVSDSTGEADKAVREISAVLPEAAGLARIEARQLAFVEKLTRVADARSQQARYAIQRVGLNADLMLASLKRPEGQGGPLIPLFTGSGSQIDPRFERLGLSLARMSALQRGLATLPSTRPANLPDISSGFGFRADPFTGGAAFHAGLDFRGPIGSPIFAAAKGQVIFTGVKQGYGNVVEIRHSHGLTTRYAHLSRIETRVGSQVPAGSVIGRLGNSGRSTGPHLHFEVRVNDRPVNPRPFLQGSPHVFQEARAQQPGNAG